MLNEIIDIESGFQSSVNIAFDLNDEKKIQSFIPTSSALELISNVISLINGDMLSELIIKHKLGLKVVEIYCLYEIDEDFYSE